MLNGSLAKASTGGETNLFTAAPSPSVTRQRRWFKDRCAKSKGNLVIERVTITPELAEIMLENNAQNRNVSASQVKKLVGAITRGEWELNGETIKFSSRGELNDGQHRLNAVIVAGRPIDTLVVFGVERETRHSLDLQKPRSLADILTIAQEKNSAVLAAALRMLWLYDENLLPAPMSPSHVQAQAILARNPDIRESCNAAAPVYSALGYSKGTWAFCHYACARIDRGLADAMFEQLATGIGFTRSTPIHRLRERFIEAAKNGEGLNSWQQAALVLKAWRMVRGLERKGIPKFDPTTEQFPKAE